VVQQATTNLPLPALKKFRSEIVLSELQNSSRRLHAKLLAWTSSKGAGCLLGSANFTTAAFDARNVEVCLLVSDAKEFVSGLFDGQFTKRSLDFEDFDSGTEQEPQAEDSEEAALQLTSVLLTESGELRVTYRHKLAIQPASLKLVIWFPDERRPHAFLNLSNKEYGIATLNPLGAVLKDAHGVILASLVAEVGAKREESLSIWVIQEGRLTYEQAGEGRR
jgi:hypothetical protein